MTRTVLLTLILALSGAAAAEDVRSSPAVESAAVEKLLQRTLDAARADGASRYHGSILRIETADAQWSVASGVGDVGAGQPMRPHDQFRCGSILKPFLATVILQLVEEGRLRLDDRLTTLLPEQYWRGFEHAADIQLHMLLNHTSGIGNWTDSEGLDLDVLRRMDKIWPVEELLQAAAKQGSHFKPGERWLYNNTAYNLLGLIIEHRTSKSWRQNVRERVFAPLALKDTFLPEPGDRTIPGDYAHGYEMIRSKERDLSAVDPSIAGAAGGHALISSTRDLSQFIEVLLAGKLFGKTGTLERMLSFVATGGSPPLVAYGLGIGKYQLPGGHTAYGHSGSTGGYASMVLHIPAQKITLTAMVNQDDGKAIARFALPALEQVLARRNE